ncbi:MAG: Tol-Pal system beta propeller repeat protein TolB [Pseudomonadota bacterium]
MRILFVLLLLLPISRSFADLRIEVTQGIDNAVRIAVVPFAWRGAGGLPEDVTEIIDSDLTLSGRFDTLPVSQMLSLPNQASEVFFRDWRLLDVEYLVIGYLAPATEPGRLLLTFELYSVFKQQVETRQTISGSIDELRDMAHHVSDVVFQNLTGIEGAFSTRIMYVTSTGAIGDREFQLNIADADGRRVETILRSREPILSATWSPDGDRVAYVSFENDARPAIYMREISTGRVQRLTSYEGLNGAPAFSPDGKQLALVLSKDGSPDIYVLNLENRRLRRITRHYGIDTEPSWTPDGKAIVFTSNRGGMPQIYMITLADLSIERLTFEGDYNAKASMLPDGNAIVMVHRREGIFHIALLDLRRGRLRVLTETQLDESPSIAPNGSMLIYATQVDNSGILAAVSIDGGVKFNLPSNEGDVREPAWSPKKRKVFEPILP